MENRNALLADAPLTGTSDHAKRLAALDMIEPRVDRPQVVTLGCNKGTAPTS